MGGQNGGNLGGEGPGQRPVRRMDRHQGKKNRKSKPGKPDKQLSRQSPPAQPDKRLSRQSPPAQPDNGGKRSWYRSTLFLTGLGVLLLVLTAGGVLLSVKLRSASGSATGASADDAATVASTTGMDAGATTEMSATEKIVAGMTLEQKIGQMMMVGFDGKAPDASITTEVRGEGIGGVILYGNNIDSTGQVRQMDAALQQLAASQPAQLMIATDQEGGSTRRFKDIGPNYSEPMIGEMRGGAGASSALNLSAAAARQLKQIGINTNLAPVADVSGGWGTLMDGRSYGDDPQIDAELVGNAVKGYNNATTISCTKHFPGLGSADDDPENTLPKVDKSLADLQASDLVPFTAAIQNDAPMIMVTHVAVPALDPTGAPASLSRSVITDLLRNQMGFKGVVITDDLEMGAITMPVGQAAVAAVAAGADIIMVAHTPAKQEEARTALIDAVKSGKLSEDEINKSVTRILDMKMRFRLEH